MQANTKKNYLLSAAACFLAANVGLSAHAQDPVYLNVDNISVSVGPNTSDGTFNNTFNSGQTIDKVIDAPSAVAEEFHNQTTHVWYTASAVGGSLELLFDFQQAYDITTLHFWNYFTEGFDVDNIDFTFFDLNNNVVGSLSIQPQTGTSPGIAAQDIELAAPLNIRFVTAVLSGSNREVDFQNLGFTASGSVADTDSDNILDNVDNCRETANSEQIDTDADGIGNACDPDFDNDCVVNFIDYSALTALFLSTDSPLHDLNSDGVINFLDVSVFTDYFLEPPGPGLPGNDCEGL